MSHPDIYALGRWFPLAAVLTTGFAGLFAAYRGKSIRDAIKVALGSGLISGVIVLIVGVAITLLFHDAMRLDPSNIHEFARSAHRPPTPAELSHFLYADALGGGINHGSGRCWG